MKRSLAWFAMTLLMFCIPIALARNTKTTVQLYGESLSSTPTTGIWWYTVLLVLPDGSHATAGCLEGPGAGICRIEPFAAEKRIKVPCDLIKGEKKGFTCYQSENYVAERKNNDITLRTGNGKVTYHINGSW